MVNPFDIKQDYKFLNGNQQRCQLKMKEQLNSSTYLMRFQLPDQEKCLGTRIGQYISLNDPTYDKETTRYYCPISRIDDIGMFDLLVHAVYAEEKNFSTHITTLENGHQLSVNGPFTSYLYHGYGKIEVPKFDINKQYRYIGVIAEASAIAAFFQLIEGIATNGDNTHISLLYVADTLDELILMEELQWLMEEKKINATFMIRNEKDPINKLFSGPKGEVKKYHLEEYLPPPNDQTLIMVCGSRQFKKSIKLQCEQILHNNLVII